MVDEASGWSLQSELISVSDLDRATSFYQDVLSIRELQRDDQVAVLGRTVSGSPLILLIQTEGLAVRRGGQVSLGLRSFSCNVGSSVELDRVEERLRALDAFRDRQVIGHAGSFEMLRGYDPDRLPLTFVAYETGAEISADDYLRVASLMYSVDV